jgi:hypothetical protein
MRVNARRPSPEGLADRGRRRRADGAEGRAGRGLRRRTAVAAVTAALALSGGAVAYATYTPGIPPAVDPGTPTFTGLDNPVPPEPVAYDPAKNMMKAIVDAGPSTNGNYWFDSILARPFASAAGETTLFTRGRALYMYTHRPQNLGFDGGYAYRERPTGGSQALYTVTLPGQTVTENSAARLQYPSYFTGDYTAPSLDIAETKFITYNNTAVTELKVTNTGADPVSQVVSVQSPIATTASADGSELTGSVTIRYGLTTVTPRLSGEGFTVNGTALTRTVSLDPGASTTLKVQMGMIASELPDSAPEYQRYKGYDAATALSSQKAEYNRFWADNVPYVDIPDQNVKKISYYRTWENRFNSFDGDIPGNDYQFPVDLEGALGYNNQISLTVPMRMQDLQWWTNPLWSYSQWLSQGEESGCQAFHDNPGNTANWNNTYEQWTAAQALQSYEIHGGPPAVLRNLAKYSECDVKGTLAKFDTNHNNLIEYSSGTLPGNDADSVAFQQYGTRPQDRTESSFWYSGAKAAAQEYELLGDNAKANEMEGIADNIKDSILGNLWANGPIHTPGGTATTRVPGELGSAVKLSGSGDFITLPNNVTSSLNGDWTVSTWVNPQSNAAWSRIFDFGTGTTRYMFLTGSAGGGPIRFAISTGGGGAAEQVINGTGQLPLNQWSHVAVVVSGTTGTLYVNGQPVGTNANITIHPSDLGNTNQNWIGRSQYGDPLLRATVDDFNIYSRALSPAEVTALAGGQAGAGDVADYKFDDPDGPTAIDSSPNARNATISTAGPIDCPGKVFLQRDLTTGNLVCWKDQQNFAPFIDGIAPNNDEYKQALRYYADKAQFPIMPVYTANQADKAEAAAHGSTGSNNFSNINATLQARLYSNALRNYPSQYITPDMYRKMIEWLSWNEYIGGDNRFPDNNEYFFNWDPNTQTLGRSGIHHDVLGSFNWMIFQDVAGLQPRLDDKVELYPIDMGYDHFTVNNLSYHGTSVTIVWQKPGGTQYYPLAPMGYSLYVGGRRMMTVDDLAHVIWNPASGKTTVEDGSATHVNYSAQGYLAKATEVGLNDNPRLVDAFQKAGVDLKPQTSGLVNLALHKDATASFTTTTPASQATSPANATDGFTISGEPVTSGAYVGTNPIWGDLGSPTASDWLQIDLGAAKRFDQVKLYFFSNKAWGSNGSTYKEPSDYSIQYFDGTNWVDVPGQVKTPATPAPNYNQVDFPPVTAQLMRVMVTKSTAPDRAVGIKEVQVFDTGSQTQASGGVGGTVPATLALTLGTPASFGAFTPGVAHDYSASTTADVVSTAGEAALGVADPDTAHPGHLVNGSFVLPQPLQARARNSTYPDAAFAPLGAAPLALLSYPAPISHDAVTIDFTQSIGATDALRTGAYAKTLVFTLSTTTP